jgi:hypothetical protein
LSTYAKASCIKMPDELRGVARDGHPYMCLERGHVGCGLPWPARFLEFDSFGVRILMKLGLGGLRLDLHVIPDLLGCAGVNHRRPYC